MENDLIRRSDVIDKLKECLKKASPPLMYPDWNDAVLAVMTAPAVDAVEVRHAYWIDMGDFESCSACQSTHLKEFQSCYGKVIWIKSDWCPACGARMDGRREDGEA